MSTIYLTTEEQTVFASMPEAKGWKVVSETVPQDTQEAMNIRYGLMRLRDPQLKSFQEGVRSAKSQDDVIALVKNIDLTKLSDDDLSELYFAMGAVGITTVIAGLLTDKAPMDAIAAFSDIRHQLLLA